MRSDADTGPDPALLSAKSRRSSISAIPRPKSGSSRQAAPSGARTVEVHSRSSTYTSKNPYVPRGSWYSNDPAPPSSFRLPQSSSASAEALLPYKQRSHNDLSGIQHQLYLRNFSTHSLSGPDVIPINSRGKQMATTGGLQKSKTMGSLISSSREIIPRRRLLQPLSPPIPRTQTLGNISCFGPTSQTPSPRKPKSVALPSAQQHGNVSQLNVADALVDSRMTAKEMGLMVQVQREAAVNRARLRNAFDHAPDQCSKGTPPREAYYSLIVGGTPPAPATGSSGIELAASRRPGKMKRRSASSRLLFINSALANNACSDSDPPTTTTLTTFTSSDLSEISHSTPKQVRLCNHTRG